jgi:predicted nucleic acid-binding protein
LQPLAISVVVCDSDPLIALGRLDKLGLLFELFQDLQVPRAVLAECVLRPELANAKRIQSAVSIGLLLLCEAQPVRVDGLGAGESAAIGRAMEIGAALLADDLAARHYAQGLGLTLIGTLGVLVRAKRKGLVPAVRPLVEQLRAGGQRLSHSAVAEALTAAGE